MNNGIDQVKQFQAELDKATASIGVAELAAEEELQHKKLDNLLALQKEKISKLNELMNLEEERLNDLARIRLSLSDRQFEARKKEIQEELRLTREEAEKSLAGPKRKYVNQKSSSAEKSASTPKNAASFSKAKTPTEETANTKLIGLLQSIDTTLTSVQSTINTLSTQKEKQSLINIDSELVTPANTENTQANVVNSGQVNADISSLIDAALDTHFAPIHEAINSLQSHLESQSQLMTDTVTAQTTVSKEATNNPIQESYKANEAASSPEAKVLVQDGQGGHPEQPTELQYNSNSKKLNKVDLGEYDLDSVKNSFDGLRSYFEAQSKNANSSIISTLKDLNSILAPPQTDSQNNTEVANPSQTTIDIAGALLESIEAANKADEVLQQYKGDSEEAILNRRLLAATVEHELRKANIEAEQKAINDKIAAEAKAQDLIANKEQYILNAREARDAAFAEEQNKLQEERLKALGEIEWNRANRQKLLDKEEQKERLGYLAEYQKLQADGFSHLTENMTEAEFEKLRAETVATEKALKARSKANEAFDKAFAIQKGKGTLKEKNQLINAVVKERVAEKDWSKAGARFQMQKITDDMSAEEKARIQRENEEAQKRRENAVKAEMAVNAAMGALANLAQQLNAQTDKIGAKQAIIDTRLQGSSANDKLLGSYWKQLARDMNKLGAVNPYFTQDDFANNIETLINKGISFDLKQRAFLMTIQEKIANTFDAADGTLLRLIRIQQQDTTAGRLGMESALNSFLNSMYETSEYLSDVASSVRGSLEELQSLMEGAAATELEFQVQKWMGSLYSVGMSDSAVNDIARAFGQIASGDISGLNGSGTGNLLIMAANEAGMSIADILQEGLDATETNKLMQAMVNYLAEIAETSSDSRVVQQQLANVYGIKASDLKAATNLASSIKAVSKQDLTYSGMLGQLQNMANSMILRTSTGEFLNNIWDNVQYTMATQMANDPMLYLLPRVATLLEDYAGGIDLPFVNVMGFGVDLNTSVAQLMNVAAMSGSILGALGPMISGLSNLNSDNLLRSAGIDTKNSKIPVIARGTGSIFQNFSGSGVSESGYIGNSSGSDIKNATLQGAEDDKKKQLVEAKDEETADDVVIKSQQAVIDIYNLLEELAHGSQSLRVRLVNNNGGVVGGGINSGVLNDYSSSSSTGSGVNTGADNGNWVFNF